MMMAQNANIRKLRRLTATGTIFIAAAGFTSYCLADSTAKTHGVLDLSLGYVDNGTSSRGVILTDVARRSSASFEYEHLIGKGMRWLADFDVALKPDSGCAIRDATILNSTIVNSRRNCLNGRMKFLNYSLGAQTPYGKFRVGRELTASTYVFGQSEVHLGGYWGSTLAIGSDKLTTRTDKAVHYESPIMRWRLQARMTLGFDAQFEESRTIPFADLSVSRKNGPAFFGVGIQRDWDRCSKSKSDPLMTGRTFTAGGGYTGGRYRVRLGHARAECGNSLRVSHYSLGVAYRYRGFTVTYQLHHLRNKLTKSSGVTHAVALRWRFNRVISLYSSFGRIRNADGATFSLAAANVGLLTTQRGIANAVAFGVLLRY